MVSTHPSAKTENIAISEEIRNYFSDLIKPLVANKSLEEILSKLNKEIMSKFEEKFKLQINRIEKLEAKLERQANRIKEVESKLLCRKTCQIS